MERISKDKYYLEIAKSVALRSPCLRRKYGAIIVKEDAIVSTGYNGPARGSTNCIEVGCIKELLNLPHYSGYDYCPAVHAEENCVSGETFILQADGTIEKARDTNTTLISFDTIFFKPLKVRSQKFESLKKEVIKITTKRGISIEVSPDHIMLVLDRASFLKEKLAKEVTINDYLPFPSKIEIEGKPQTLPEIEFERYKLKNGCWKKFYELIKKHNYTWKSFCEKCSFSLRVLSNLKNYRSIKRKNMRKILEILPEAKNLIEGVEIKKIKIPKKTSPEFCQIVGYFIGDGSLSKNYIAFHDAEKSVLTFYNKLIKKVFGIKGKIRKSWKGTHFVLIVSSHRLYLLFKKLNFGVRNKRKIPKIFHRIENESLSRLIRGIFDAEGTVGERAIHFSSSSRNLIEVLRLLLLRFGIFSSVYKIKRGSSNSFYYSLEISGVDLIKFKKKIGFSFEKKMKKLEEVLKKNPPKFSSLRVYPVEWFKKFKIPTTKFSVLRDKNKKNVTYFLAKKLLKEIKRKFKNDKEVEKLEKILNNIIFLKVKEVKVIRKKTKMFDFYVPPFHNFIANGIIVHNCIANAARNGSSVLGGTLYLYGIDAKTNKPVAGMPCPRCKRLIINAGIVQVVTIDENGNIVKYDVKKWVEEDKNWYIENYRKFEKQKS